MPCVDRCNSGTPRDCSSARRRRLTVGCVVCSRGAAAERLPASTIRTKVSSSANRSAGTAGSGPYCAANAAVVRPTESLAAELRERGVGVNCVLPGTIDTSANRAGRPEADFTRWVPPAAIADVILFLCSEAARGVHGAAIPVYGLS